MIDRLRPYFRNEALALFIAYTAMAVLALASTCYVALTGPVLKMMFGGSFPTLRVPLFAGINQHLAKFSANPKQALWLIPLCIVVVAFIKGLAQTVQFRATGGIAQRVVQRLREETFSHLLLLSPRFFTAHNTADLLARLTSDSDRIEQGIFYGLMPIVRESITIFALLSYCVYLSPALSLIAFVIIPISAFPLLRFSKYLKKASRQSQDQLSDLSFTAFEALSGIRTVQAYGMEDFERQRFVTSGKNHLKAMYRSYFIRAIRTPAMEFLGAMGVAGLAYYLSLRVSQGSIDTAQVVSFATAVLLLYDPIKKLGNVGDFVAQANAAQDRIFEVHDAGIEIHSSTIHSPVTKVAGNVSFDHVSFAYEKKTVIDELSLNIEAGTLCAIVGSSGAGKSTLMQLLLRFYDVQQGRIMLDGCDIRQWPLHLLRRQFAWVSQEIFLFNASVRANLVAGEIFSDHEIEKALAAAHALEFVRALPQGLETRLGERGVILSGGQRQRIAIARAFLRDAKVLLLDEATSALDAESERMVQGALDRLMTGRTALVIAHRLSTIRRAQKIAVLESGSITQLGTHDQLVQTSGSYQRLASIQLGVS